MKWNRYTIKTTTEAVDLISCMLAELGIEGIEIQDNVQLTQEEAKTMFVDFIPELPPDDGTAKVNFYIDADEDDNTILGKVEEGLEELRTFVNVGDATVTESQTEDKDWINNWKQYWHTFTIGDLYIKPTWEPVTDEMKGHQVLSIDPGTAFGTGSHETTRMVILQLQKYIKGGEDAQQNDIAPEKLEVIEGNIIDDKAVQDRCGYECYDVVCANILADVLEPLSAEITQHMKPGAYFITSGIIDTKEQEVAECFKKNPELEIVEINHDGEWVNITARKRGI